MTQARIRHDETLKSEVTAELRWTPYAFTAALVRSAQAEGKHITVTADEAGGGDSRGQSGLLVGASAC